MALRVRRTHANPYATHLPVLSAASSVIKVRSVLELGSGPFSTSLFLDRRVFPDLEKLTSYEDDPSWAAVVIERVGPDPRLDFRMVESVSQSVSADVGDYDLVFIDDSRLPVERTQTIESVAAMRPKGLVAIHDFELKSYRHAAKVFDHRQIFRTFTPQVGFCWFGDTFEAQQWRDVAIMVEAGSHLDPTDQDAWLAHLKPQGMQ